MNFTSSSMLRTVGSAAALTAASTCWSQGSLTLYGVTDAGIEYVNHLPGNGSSSVRLSTGNIAANRFGMRGIEDLGGSLTAIFVLESGFDLDTGRSTQGGRLFGRNAYVGLKHAQWGSLTLGRQINALYETFPYFEPMGLATKYSVYSQDVAFVGRADNTIKYTGRFGPVTASGFYSFGADSNVANGSEVPGEPKLGRDFGGYLAYSSDNIRVTAAYDEANTGTTIRNADAKTRRIVTGGAFSLGNASVFAGYRWARAYDGAVLAGATPGAGNQASNLYWVGVTYDVTPNLNIAGAAYYQDFRNTGNDPWLLSLRTEYLLSKRTRAYASVGYTINKGTSNLGFFDGGKSFGNTNPGQNQFGAVVGMRHSF